MGKDINERLMSELREYSKRYEKSLREAGEAEENIKVKVDKWVNDTYEFYINSEIDVDDMIKRFSFLNETGAEIQTENVDFDVIKKVK